MSDDKELFGLHSVYVRLAPKQSGTVTTSEVAPDVLIDFLAGEAVGVEILNVWTVEVDGKDVIDVARRVWWWPARDLSQRWRLFLRGGDEFGNRTVGIRVPGGMVIVALNIPLRTDLMDMDDPWSHPTR